MDVPRGASCYRAVATGPNGITVMERRPILSIRRKLPSVSDESPLVDLRYSLFVSGARVYYEILCGHVLQGDPVWAPIDADFEYDMASKSTAGGTCLANGYVEGGRGSESGSTTGMLERLRLDGHVGVISIVCRSISQRSALCFGAIELKTNNR